MPGAQRQAPRSRPGSAVSHARGGAMWADVPHSETRCVASSGLQGWPILTKDKAVQYSLMYKPERIKEDKSVNQLHGKHGTLNCTNYTQLDPRSG